MTWKRHTNVAGLKIMMYALFFIKLDLHSASSYKQQCTSRLCISYYARLSVVDYVLVIMLV
jgi:hypothetical protein